MLRRNDTGAALYELFSSMQRNARAASADEAAERDSQGAADAPCARQLLQCWPS